jgi:hypothetical protein
MMVSFLTSLFSFTLGAYLVDTSFVAVGADQVWKLMGATLAFGVSALCFAAAGRAALAALRWRWHRAQLRHGMRRATYR